MRLSGQAFVASFLLVASQAVAQAADPPDLQAYVDSIRKAGMTEDATSDLGMVASILVGSTTLEILRDKDGRLGERHYGAPFCVRPGMSKEAEEKARAKAREMTAKVQQEIARLRPFADLDGSGFVSSEEGSRFRNAFLFGREVAAVVAEGTRDLAELPQLLGRPEDVTREQWADYLQFRQKPELREIFPELPVRGSRQGAPSGR